MLNEATMQLNGAPCEASQTPGSDLSDEKLLKDFLDLPEKQRAKRFADTARAAKLTGLSQHTIVNWIKHGHLRATRIGKKYQVELASLYRYLKYQESQREGR
jgi:excisionase family DNA binding protein